MVKWFGKLRGMTAFEIVKIFIQADTEKLQWYFRYKGLASKEELFYYVNIRLCLSNVLFHSPSM